MAVITPSFFWASILWSLTVAALAVGVLAAAFRRDGSQAFWCGFSLFGSGHMVLSLAPWFADRTGALIFTRLLLDRLAYMLGHEATEIPSTMGFWEALSRAASGGGYEYLNYLVAGQSLCTLAIAVTGGFIGQYVHRQGVGRGLS